MGTKLTRGRLVMVHFTCHLDWHGAPRLNIISGCDGEGASR